ncbi:MAG TPA: flavin reductase family protein [Solirubrobacteraceae bacterium]|nr:flavin reductase family protein [Solirubrobacteraceae bacterium]
MSAVQAPQPIDPRALRRALGKFVTGVTVLTAVDRSGRRRGLTANSFTSVSLDPPLILVCIDRRTASYDVFVKTDEFAVNILAEDQIDLANRFASSGPDKFADVRIDPARPGPPILDSCPAWLSCRTVSREAVGDHMIVVGRVVEFSTTVRQPLAFCQGGYVSLAPDSIEAIGGSSERVVVSWLVECDGRIVLGKTDDGYDLPTAPWRRNRLDDEGLATAFRTLLGIDGDVQSLFSVFDDHERGVLTLVYRALGDGPPAPGPGLCMFDIDAIPWPDIHRPHLAETLGRYLSERATSHFGIYAGSLERGHVARVLPTANETPVQGGSS